VIICSNCQFKNAKDATYCEKCGSELFKECSQGHKYPARYGECPYCRETILVNGQYNPESEATQVIDGQEAFQADNEVGAKIPERTMVQSLSVSAAKPNQAQRKLIGWLVTFDLNEQGSDFQLREGRTRIGREAEKNDVVIVRQGISDSHALLLYRNGKLLIRDEMSTNGTYVNGEFLEDRIELHDNDIIQLASVKLKLKLIGSMENEN